MKKGVKYVVVSYSSRDYNNSFIGEKRWLLLFGQEITQIQ